MPGKLSCGGERGRRARASSQRSIEILEKIVRVIVANMRVIRSDFAKKKVDIVAKINKIYKYTGCNATNFHQTLQENQ